MEKIGLDFNDTDKKPFVKGHYIVRYRNWCDSKIYLCGAYWNGSRFEWCDHKFNNRVNEPSFEKLGGYHHILDFCCLQDYRSK